MGKNFILATSGSDGSFTFNNVTSINEIQLPTGYLVSNNYPNPFNPKTRIYFSLPENGKIRAVVYNLLGQKVIDEIEKYAGAGTGFIDIELNGLPNGVYLAQVTLDEKFTITKKMMLLYGSQHLNLSSNFTNNMIPEIKNMPDVLSSRKITLSIKVDSIVVFGAAIKKNTFNNFGIMSGNNVTIGDLTINTTTTGYRVPALHNKLFRQKL